MLEEKLTRIKKLMEQRDKINAELAELVGMSAAAKRGRPRKEQSDGSSAESQLMPQSTEADGGGALLQPGGRIGEWTR